MSWQTPDSGYIPSGAFLSPSVEQNIDARAAALDFGRPGGASIRLSGPANLSATHVPVDHIHHLSLARTLESSQARSELLNPYAHLSASTVSHLRDMHATQHDPAFVRFTRCAYQSLILV